ncbi:family 64 putative glycoside hydrolase [Cladorrhinum sp. PSN332]|nr:family 64 putative glycoside hydrolase [Cladorrhinum sp. PSN332]
MPDSLTIQLVNQSATPTIYAFITGLAIQKNNARVFAGLGPNNDELYFPEQPPPGKLLQPLTRDCAIPLNPPNAPPVTVTIPQLAGGRIWFSADKKLVFKRNPGGPANTAALVEPSVLNPTDENINTNFTFCEFTLNDAQLFANISYVDFVGRIPIGLTLRTRSGGGKIQHVSGMPEDGLERVCEGLREQSRRDGRPWDKLVVLERGGGGRALRVLSPTHGNAVRADFGGLFDPLVDKVWEKYAEGSTEVVGTADHNNGEKKHHHGLKGLLSGLKSHQEPGGTSRQRLLRIDTQCGLGVVTGYVERGSGDFVIGGERFKRPTTADVLGCNSGPFTTGPSALRNAIIPRFAAAFQRSCILDVTDHPSAPETFYRCEPTNHYCRIIHECSLDGKGYAFAYDDVQQDGGGDQSGKVNAGDPEVFIVAVGGRGAYVGDRMP